VDQDHGEPDALIPGAVVASLDQMALHGGRTQRRGVRR
jgi:hypothetical protein